MKQCFILGRRGGEQLQIIIVRDRTKLWRSEEGIVIMNILEFLLNPDSLDLQTESGDADCLLSGIGLTSLSAQAGSR